MSSPLQLIHRSDSPKNLVVAISGIGLPPPERWCHPSEAWLRALPPRALPAPAIYSFRHGINSDDQRTWENLFNQGGILLEAILKLKDQDDELRSCAVLLVAHSLGGIIVKEALCAAFSEAALLQPFRNSIAGAILMGTLHSRSEDERFWRPAQYLLTPRGKTKKCRGIEPSSLKRLAQLSTQFETTATSVPILSIYETEVTVMKKTFGPSRVMLIGQDAVELGAVEEQLLAIKTNHFNLCNVDVRSAVFPIVEAFVERSIEKVKKNIERHADQFAPPPTLDEPTVAANLSRVTTAVSIFALSDGATSSGNRATFRTSQAPQERLSQIADIGPDITAAKRDPQLPCFSVPVAQNSQFFGRGDIITRLAECLCPSHPDESTEPTPIPSPPLIPSGSRDLRTFGICGSGGFGKTQIAAQFVHEYKEYFDAVFWLHAEEDVLLGGEFAHIAVQLNLVPEASQEANDLVIATGLVKGWLAKPLKSYNTHGRTTVEEASWLLVFDNVAHAETLIDYWPETGSSGSVLLTSRDPLAKSNWYNVSQGITLEGFDIDEAASFLLKTTWRENDASAKTLAPRIVKMLGCHPLALVQMASIIVREQLSYSDFIKSFQEEAEHAELFEQTFVPKQRQQTSSHTIASVWALHTLKFGGGLLHAVSFFDPDGIQEELLEAAVGLEDTYHYPSTTTKYQKARGELLNSSLISKDASEQKLLIHRLIQDAVWAKLADPRKNTPTEAAASFNSAVAILQNSWPRAGYAERMKKARWDKCEAYAPHILRLRNRFLRASLSLKNLLGSNIRFSDLLNELGWYFQERARAEEAGEIFKTAQLNLTSILENDSSSLSQALKDKAKFLLAETHRNLGCSTIECINPDEAMFHFTEYNKLMKEEFQQKGPNNDSRLAISYLELGTAYILLEKYVDAERCNISALEEAKKLTEPLKAKYTLSLPQINLAHVYMLTGRLNDAEALLLKTLKEREEVYGANDRVPMITGRVYHGLGLLKEMEGKFVESHKYQIQAMNHMLETVGPYHHRTADMIFKVGQLLVRLDEKDEAIKHLDLATKTYNEQACYCAERGRVLYWRAKLEERHHGSKRAEPYFSKALKLYKEARPNDTRPIEQLHDEDLDRAVIFWSK